MSARPQSRPEELLNSLTHGTGLLASLAALPVLVVAASGSRSAAHLVGSAVFGATLVLLYLASTVYHALPSSPAKRVFRVLDHAAIYLLIAGTYTPFALGPLRGPWGWSLLGTIWGLALLGIVIKAAAGIRYPRLSTALYVAMGWLGIIAAEPILANIPTAGVAWLVAGGLCYTGGVVFYLTDTKLRYGHAVWHLFVLAGSACHFVAVLRHAAPVA
jgi:hemolysin III